jgi:hypothetical protein
VTSSRESIQITIEYKKVGDTEWTVRHLTPDEYFEVSPDGDPITVDSVPRHDHGIDYLGLEPRDVHAVRLIISGLSTGSGRTIAETFWNKGRCRAIERVDTGSEPYWELMVESRISDAPPSWDILRVVRREGVLEPVYHGIIRENDDGSQEEKSLLSD